MAILAFPAKSTSDMLRIMGNRRFYTFQHFVQRSECIILKDERQIYQAVHRCQISTISDRSRPCLFDPTKWELTLDVRKVIGQPDDVVYFAGDYGVVSERVADFFTSLIPKDCQRLPVNMMWPKKYAGSTPRYQLVNFHREIDAANLSEQVVHVMDPPDPDFFDSRGTCPLDPELVPDDANYFHRRYVGGGTVVSEFFAKAMQGSPFNFMSFEPVRLMREDPECRMHRLAWLKRQTAIKRAEWEIKEAARTRLKTSTQLEEALGVKLPEKVSEYFDSGKTTESDDVEVFNLAEAVDATQQVRDWPGLIWPRHMVCVAEDGRGGYWVIDTSLAKQGDCPVLYFDHELATTDKKTGKITPNFELCRKTFTSWRYHIRQQHSPYPSDMDV